MRDRIVLAVWIAGARLTPGKHGSHAPVRREANLSLAHRLPREDARHVTPCRSRHPPDRSGALPAGDACSYAAFCAEQVGTAEFFAQVKTRQVARIGAANVANASGDARGHARVRIRGATRCLDTDVASRRCRAARSPAAQECACVQAELEPFHALIRQRGADATMVGSLRRLTCRHEQAPAGRCPVERRGGSRGRTAWPRPREPGTAG